MHLVFVINADRGERTALTERLRHAGFSVTAMPTFADAISTLHILHPDVVVADIEPPVQYLSAAFESAAILIYTAAETLTLHRLNPSQVFRNPVERERLLQTIHLLCEGKTPP